MAVVFDSVGFSAELDSLKSKVSDKIRAQLKAAVTEEAQSQLVKDFPKDKEAKAYTKFYKSITVKQDSKEVDKEKILSEDVYKTIMLGAAQRDKTISAGLTIKNLDSKTVSAVGIWVRGILGDEKIEVTVGKKKYTVTMNAFSAKVKVPGETEYLVTWDNDLYKKAKNALQEYINNLTTYLSNYRYQIYGAIIKDGMSSLIDEFVTEVAENFDTAKKELITEFHKWALNSITEKGIDVTIDKILPDTYKQIKDVETFVSKLNGLKEYAAKVSDDSIKGSKEYTAFVTAYNNLGIGNYVDVVDNYFIHTFSEVTMGIFDENKAFISGTDSDNNIRSNGSYATINGNAGNDKILAIGSNACIRGGSGNDSIVSRGSNSEINGDGGNDYISVSGNKNSIKGGSGNDTIFVNASSVTVDGGTSSDKIIIGSKTKNVVINNFETFDILDFSAYNASELYAGKYQNSLEILSKQAYSNILFLSDVTSGTSNNILCKDENGKVITVSIDWLLANAPQIITPYTVTVPAGGNFNNSLDNRIITTQLGNSSITNNGNYVTINGDAGKDAISNTGNDVSINSGDGNDSIKNEGTRVKINSGKNNDYIDNNNSKVTINAGTGNDSISNNGESVSIDAGVGNDRFFNGSNGSKVTINTGVGNDTINNYGDSIIIKAGDGKDSIYNDSNSSTIDGNDGNDTIQNGFLRHDGHNSSINGGSGNDSIHNYGNSVTIDSGMGNDTVSNHGNNLKISLGDGSDRLFNGDDPVDSDGYKVTISAGDGNDSIYNKGASVSISGGSGNDSIYNIGSNATISGGKGNDSIISYNSSSVEINAGDDNDYVDNSFYGFYGSDVTINTGAGNDSVYNGGASVSIDASTGNDSIHNYGNSVTIDSGMGNDTIENSGNNVLFNYEADDGNDIIYGFKADSTLSISGSSYSTTKSDSDIIVIVGDGKITLNGAASLSSVNIDGEEEPIIKTLTVTNKTASPVTVKSDVEIINASKRTKAIKITGNKLANTISGGSSKDSIYGGKGNDSIVGNAGNDKLYGEAGNDFLLGGKGNDTLIGGKGNDSLTGGADADIFVYSSGNDVIIDYSPEDKISIASDWSYVYKASGNDVIFCTKDGYITVNNGLNNMVNYADKAGEKIANLTSNTIISETENKYYVYNTGSNVTINTSDNKNFIENYGSKVTISGGKGNDTIYNNYNFETNNTIDDSLGLGEKILFEYKSGDGNDIIYGFKADSTLSISGSSYSTTKNGSDIIVSAGNGKISLIGAANLSNLNIKASSVSKLITLTENDDTYINDIEGVMIDAGKGNDSILNTLGGSNTSISAGTGDDYILNLSSQVTISGGTGDDLIQNWHGMNISVSGGDGNDYIINQCPYSTINGDSGDDYIQNGYTDAYLIGGAGNDTVSLDSYYAKNILIGYNVGDGNDIIYGFRADSTLSISGSSYSTTKSGSDIIVTVGDGKITLNSAASLEDVNIVGNEKSTVQSTLLTVTDSTKSPVAVSSSVKIIDASTRTTKVEITGNRLNNTISGGSKNDSIYGGAGNDSLNGGNGADTLSGGSGNDKLLGGSGNDSLIGGTGNDSLWGDAGADTFFYAQGDGKDVIYGFDSKDTLTLDGLDFSASYSKKNNAITFKVDGGSVILKEFGTTTTFHVIDDIYKISGTKLIKK